MSKFAFALANIIYKFSYPAYKILYYSFKRKQDAFEIELLKRFIKKGNIVLDIGANVGFYSEIIAELVGPQGEVHSFEPDPVNFRHLADSCKKKSNVFANNMAVSNEPGELKLYTSKFLNVDHRTYPVDNYGESFNVKAVTIDHYLKGKKVDFIKMDIQGAEMFALQGMKETLTANKDVKLICEFWPFGLRSAGFTVAEFQQFLIENGFLLYLILNDEPVILETLSEYADKPEEDYYNILLSRTAL